MNDTKRRGYRDLADINVSSRLEKKGSHSYLSWAWAVDYLMREDETAWWEFDEPLMFGDTMMVRCRVHAMGKSISMHLPVMDARNNAIKAPDARKVSDAMMRCLTKAIATFGIGLHVYAGEDVPRAAPTTDLDLDALIINMEESRTLDELKAAYVAGVRKVGKTDPDSLTLLEAAKNAQKARLEASE
jgi:hypothetical protein